MNDKASAIPAKEPAVRFEAGCLGHAFLINKNKSLISSPQSQENQVRLHTQGLKVLTSRENISAIRNLLGEEQGSSSINQPMSTTLCRTLGTLKELRRRVHISNLPNLLLSSCCGPATLTLLATFLPSNTESLPWSIPTSCSWNDLLSPKPPVVSL